MKETQDHIQPHLRSLAAWASEIMRHVSDSVLDLVLTIVVMVVIERKSGYAGLGVYSYFLSLYLLARYFADWGISRRVEILIASGGLDGRSVDNLMRIAQRALLYIGIVCLSVFIIIAVSATVHTELNEKSIAYVLVGLAVMVHGLNHLRLSALNGWGRHDLFIRMQFYRRIAFFISVIVLVNIGINPSYIVIAFIVSEIVVARSLSEKGLPAFNKGQVHFKDIRALISEGGKGLFADDALRFVLFIDFFVLGIFVSSAQLGLYAEATILGRLFLIIPLSVRPLVRRRILETGASHGGAGVFSMIFDYARYSFLFHSALALVIALHFKEAAGMLFFVEYPGYHLSADVFSILMPGLLAYSTLCMAESAYDATGKVEGHRNLVVGLLLCNVILNIYFVPYAGIYGAATATTLTLLLYFIFFGRGLQRGLSAFKGPVLVAGCSVYLLYEVLSFVGLGFGWDLLLVMAGLPLLYWLGGFFLSAPASNDVMAGLQTIETGGVND